MTRRQDSDQGYDWDYLRKWLLWYVDVFVQYSRMPGQASHDWFQGEVKGRLLDWRKVKMIANIHVRNTVETITAQISEAVATRESLTGDFADAVAVLQQEEKILRRDSTPEVIWTEIQRIEQ
jgi:hypothetical protein